MKQILLKIKHNWKLLIVSITAILAAIAYFLSKQDERNVAKTKKKIDDNAKSVEKLQGKKERVEEEKIEVKKQVAKKKSAVKKTETKKKTTPKNKRTTSEAKKNILNKTSKKKK
jgi:hypothetical protein